jgi:ketosteroid isomerase-like protein
MEADMGHREDMLELVHKAYAARARADVEGLVTTFHPEGVFTLVGDESALALAGSVQGHPNLREAFGQFVAGFGFVERKILSELVDGQRVAVHSRLVIRYHPTETTFSTDALDLFRIEDGKIVELIEFADTAKIKALIA